MVQQDSALTMTMTTTTPLMATAATAVASMMVAAVAGTWYHYRTIQKISKTWEDRRNEERKGRIRCEVKLRALLKEQQQQQQQTPLSQQHETTLISDEDELHPQQKNLQQHQQKRKETSQKLQQHAMLLKCIGTVVSPYTKRVGTPRQGALVPSSRGYIDVSSVLGELFLGMSDYSHIWIIFGFHANTDLLTSTKTKIRPPRAPPGTKVGQLATRSPHRPNAIGLSLVKFERFDSTKRRLYISGLDLVNGTPVYDIKPFVPWDIPGYYESKNQLLSTTTSDMSATTPPIIPYKIPHWVGRDDDELSQVTFSTLALEQLQQVIDDDRLAPLYTNDNDGVTAARQTLEQVLAQDPRSSHRGLKNTTQQRGSKGNFTTNTDAKATLSTATSATPYRFYFGNTGIDFVVEDSGVQVVKIEAVEFPPDSYTDGIPVALFE